MNNKNYLSIILSVIGSDLCNPNYLKLLSTNPTLLNNTIKFAKLNGLYYIYISKLKEYKIKLSKKEELYFTKELQNLTKLKNTIQILNKASHESGIDYTLIKACNTIQHVPRDIDIYILEQNLLKFIEALEKNGMQCIHSDKVDTTLVAENCVKVDIYTGLCYFSFEFIDSTVIVNSTIECNMFNEQYKGLKPEVDFLIILVHGMFGHSSYSLLDLLHMKNLTSTDFNIDFCKKYASNHGWGDTLDLVMSEIESINNRIYKHQENLSFPYIFKLSFILKCIYNLKGLNMSASNKFFLYISLMQDRFVLKVKGTPLYDVLKSIGPIRKIINSIGYIIRNLRGDVRSA